MTLCERICFVCKKASPKKNRVHVDILREQEHHGSKESLWHIRTAEVQKEELDENESQICFCNLRNLREENGPFQVQESINNLCALAETKLGGVLQATCKYRQSIHKISPKHRLHINKLLQAVITSADHIDYKLANVIIKLAAEDMLRTTDLQDLYQDTAGDILVTLWNHFPTEVLTKLLEGFRGQVLPYRSILRVLGKLANKVCTESDTFKINLWERKLVEFVERLLIDVNDKACFEELHHALQTHPSQTPEKVFLYQYYGAILRASDDALLVQDHLYNILAMSQRGPWEAKGIASAIGLAAARHPTEVFKALEEFDSSVETAFYGQPQYCRWNTLLLCYGRVALGIKEEVLPRVELIMSKMIEYFEKIPPDINLKKRFLIAVLMFLEAVSATGKAQDIRLPKKASLVECLIVLIQGEPLDSLSSTVRQDAMYIVKELSKLKPLLEAEEKSRLLCASFQSIFCLAPWDLLEGQRCTDGHAGDIQGLYQKTIHSFEEMLQGLLMENPQPRELQYIVELMESWMTSHLDHVRERAVEAAVKLLKFVAGHFPFDLCQEFCTLAHTFAVLTTLCNDPVQHVCNSAAQGVSYLYEILLRRKGLERVKSRRMKWPLKSGCRMQEDDSLAVMDKNCQVAMNPADQIFSCQLTSLLLFALHNLRGSSVEMLKASEEILSAVLQNHTKKIQRVKEIVEAIYTCLQLCHSSCWTRKVVLKAFALVIPDHLEEVAQSCLSFSLSVDRHAKDLWTVMASGPQIAGQVLHLLLKHLQVKESLEGDEESTSTSLAAMNVIHETFQIPGYRAALAEMYHQLFIPLLKQVLFVMKLNMPGSVIARETSVEIMKNLFSVSGDWAVYACIEFQEGWVLLNSPQEFLQGPRLLARAMAECHSCQIPGIFGEAALILNTEDDELKKVTSLALVIEFLKSPSAVKLMNRFSLKDYLEEGSTASNPVIQGLCLKGLSSFVFQEEKVKLLREQLPALINSVFSGEAGSILEGLKEIMATVYEMDGQAIGPLCVDLTLNVRSFFEDERASVRETAISLFGQLVMRAQEADKALLWREVLYSLLPLLLHLKDRDNTVAMRCKLTLLRCASFLGWNHLKLLFRSLAWDSIQTCMANVWKYLMRNNQSDIHIFISQALGYLHHPQAEIRHSAARFTGYTLNYYSSELSKNLEQEDIFCLNKVFQEMERSPEPSMARFGKTYRVVVQKLSVKRRFSAAGEKQVPVEDGSTQEKQFSECETRASSPMPLLPKSPLPEGAPAPDGSQDLCLPILRQARRSLAQRGKQPSEFGKRDRSLPAEAPARIAATQVLTEEGRKPSPQRAHGHLSQEVNQP